MGLTAKVETIDRDIEVLLNQDLSPEAQSASLAAFARDALQEGESANEKILGRIPPHTTSVDGSKGSSEDRVRPNGTIVYEFELLTDLFKWIADALIQKAPVGSAGDPHPGLYKSSFGIYADGEEIRIGDTIPENAREYVFINELPYSRKIENGFSPQAPEGVFEGVAALARSRFGNVAKIEFNYRAPLGTPKTLQVSPKGTARARTENKAGNRYPAIIVTLR